MSSRKISRRSGRSGGCRTCGSKKRITGKFQPPETGTEFDVLIGDGSTSSIFAIAASGRSFGVKEPLIRSYRMKPRIGGWSVNFVSKGRRYRIDGTPEMIARRIEKILKKDKTPIDDQPIWDWLNAVWISREPNRATTPRGMSMKIGKKAVGPKTSHLEVSIPNIGPKVWNILSIFGMKGAFTEDLWKDAIEWVGFLINPAQSVHTGCDECYEAWRKIILDSDPAEVDSAHAAAKWIWNAHNSINVKLGKQPLSFEAAVVANNWAFVIDGQKVVPV